MKHDLLGGYSVEFSDTASVFVDDEAYSAFARNSYVARVSNPDFPEDIIIVLPLSARTRSPEDWVPNVLFAAGLAVSRGQTTLVMPAA